MAVRSKAWVCSRLIAGIAWFESRWGHTCSFLAFVVCYAGSGLCDGLIIPSEESFWVCVSLIACYLETSTLRRSRPELRCCATKKKYCLKN